MKVTKQQKYILIASGLVFVLMLLFPPWKSTLKLSMGGSSIDQEKPAGYSFIGSPPQMRDYGVEVDLTRLTFQLLGLVILAGVAALVLSERETAGSETNSSQSSKPFEWPSWMLSGFGFWASIILFFFLLIQLASLVK